MSPRAGGEADKVGNRFEGAWTVGQLLQLLAGQLDWVRVEPLGDLGDGVEFVLRRRDGGEEAHQVKRQRGIENEWSVAALKGLGVWSAAGSHIESDCDYHFVSIVPFRPLQELTERARNSNDYTSFVRGGLPRRLDALFTEISAIYGAPEATWNVVRRFHVRLFDEGQLRSGNAALAETFLEGGSGTQASASLAAVVDDNFDVVLTSDRILEALRPHGLRRRLVASQRGLAERVRLETTAWLDRVRQQLVDPAIPRLEADDLQLIPKQTETTHFLLGAAGGGKTAVLYQAVTGLVGAGVPTLVIRLDRYGTLPSTAELGRQLNLGVSLVTALAAAATGEPAVLVIDQLDAVSLASGRLPENFDIVADLVAEAAAIPNLHVVLGCRHFDVENDHRIRNLRSHVKPADISVSALADAQIDAAVSALGLSASTLTTRQRDILRLPLHLSLLASVADQPSALDFSNSQRLFDAYWEYKRQAVRQRRQSARFGQVVGRLAEVMSERQRLQVPVTVLDADDLADDAGVLVSEQLLVRDGAQIGFFHEALFDYAFARQWVNRGESLVQFLTCGEQELFRRAQVRQIMTHLRASDEARLLDEVRDLLARADIRFHIKDVALAVLGGLSDPTGEEATLLLEAAAAHPEFQDRLWMRLRTAAWFQRLDADGQISAWLDADEAAQTRALNLMAGAVGALPDRVAELLAERRDRPNFADWLRWVVRFANIETSRPLFEVLLDGVRAGVYAGAGQALWLAAHNLAEAQPEWAVELVSTLLTTHPDGLTRDALGRVKALEDREHGLTELAERAAERAPQRFLDTLLPYLLQVMAATAYEGRRQLPRPDTAFSRRLPGEVGMGDLGDVLLEGMASAIHSLVTADPTAMRPTLQLLADDPHDNAQYLLYQGLLAGSEAYADWAAELLLQGAHRFLCGRGDNSVWVARQVLQAISPLISDELLGCLEAAVRDLRFPWATPGRPAAAFTLLSALEERRLSEVGRRRLGELRRAVGRDQPTEPEGISGGGIGSPIPADKAAYMTDDNWLGAMGRHAGEREDFRTLTGGARELSHVLKTAVSADPSRFARLAQRLTADLNPAYGDAFLMGFGEADPVDDPSSVFDAVRYIASLGLPDNDRWLGYSLRQYFKIVSADLVELIRDRALGAANPTEDSRSVVRWPDGRKTQGDMWNDGINTARGSLAEALGDLLIYDIDGSRTALVTPVLNQLAQDPAVVVRSCVAHTISAALRYARPEATAAFGQLIDADDLLLAAQSVVRLIVHLGNGDPTVVRSTLERMLASAEAEVREAGGELAAFAAMQWDMGDLLQRVLAGDDPAARKGAAGMAAQRLPYTANAAVASEALLAVVEDSSGEVREAAAGVAGALRDQPLRPFESVLRALLASPAFQPALPQLLITLEHAPDQVDDLALLCAQRFVEVLGADAGDIRTSAAGVARNVGQLIIRALAQSRTPTERAALLDVLDRLLLAGAYGIEEMILESERPQ